MGWGKNHFSHLMKNGCLLSKRETSEYIFQEQIIFGEKGSLYISFKEKYICKNLHENNNFKLPGGYLWREEEGRRDKKEYPESSNYVYVSFRGFFLRFYLFILERGRERGREGEKHQCVAASHAPPTEDLARNPGLGCLTENRTSDPLVRSLRSIH